MGGICALLWNMGQGDKEQETGNKGQGTRDREQETGNKGEEFGVRGLRVWSLELGVWRQDFRGHCGYSTHRPLVLRMKR